MNSTELTGVNVWHRLKNPKLSHKIRPYNSRSTEVISADNNEIGYCENLGTGSTEVTVDWRGITNGILSLIPIPGSGIAADILGGILTFLPNIGLEQTDYTEYVEKLGKCVDAMINEAIIQGGPTRFNTGN